MQAIVALTSQYGRWGHRWTTALLVRAGWKRARTGSSASGIVRAEGTAGTEAVRTGVAQLAEGTARVGRTLAHALLIAGLSPACARGLVGRIGPVGYGKWKPLHAFTFPYPNGDDLNPELAPLHEQSLWYKTSGQTAISLSSSLLSMLYFKPETLSPPRLPARR